MLAISAWVLILGIVGTEAGTVGIYRTGESGRYGTQSGRVSTEIFKSQGATVVGGSLFSDASGSYAGSGPSYQSTYSSNTTVPDPPPENKGH